MNYSVVLVIVVVIVIITVDWFLGMIPQNVSKIEFWQDLSNHYRNYIRLAKKNLLLKNECRPDWFPSDQSVFDNVWFQDPKVKTTNAFKMFELLFLDSLSLNISNEIEPPSGIRELGHSVKLLENIPTMEFFKQLIYVPSRIFFVRASSDYSIERGTLKYLEKFGNKLLDATHIMYCFGNDFVKTDFIFKKEMPKGLHKYYVPEKNSIICFTNKDIYSLQSTRHHSKQFRLRYFMVIIIFSNF